MEKQTLAARLAAEAEAKQKALKEVVNVSADVAKAWDASGYAGRQPWLVSGKDGIYGDKATLSFQDVGPDELVALMRAFPAIPKIQYSHNNTRYWHPDGAKQVPEGVIPNAFDGFEICISGGFGQGSASLDANWSALVGNIQTKFHVDLRRVHYLHPTTYRKAVLAFGTKEFLRYEGRAELVWPKPFGEEVRDMLSDWGLTAYSYYMGDQSSGNFSIRGLDVLSLAEAWEAEANRRHADTQAAFLADKIAVDQIGLPTAEDIRSKAEQMHKRYEGKSLRAGTLEQTATLETMHAEADKQLAEKHWPAYCEFHGLEKRQGYFDHFTWACAFLARCNMYEVTIEGREKPYKYGAAWL